MSTRSESPLNQTYPQSTSNFQTEHLGLGFGEIFDLEINRWEIPALFLSRCRNGIVEFHKQRLPP